MKWCRAHDLLGREPKTELGEGLRKTIELSGVENLAGRARVVVF